MKLVCQYVRRYFAGFVKKATKKVFVSPLYSTYYKSNSILKKKTERNRFPCKTFIFKVITTCRTPQEAPTTPWRQQ